MTPCLCGDQATWPGALIYLRCSASFATVVDGDVRVSARAIRPRRFERAAPRNGLTTNKLPLRWQAPSGPGFESAVTVSGSQTYGGTPTGTVQPGTPKELFAVPGDAQGDLGTTRYISRDGQRFVFVLPAETTSR